MGGARDKLQTGIIGMALMGFFGRRFGDYIAGFWRAARRTRRAVSGAHQSGAESFAADERAL